MLPFLCHCWMMSTRANTLRINSGANPGSEWIKPAKRLYNVQNDTKIWLSLAPQRSFHRSQRKGCDCTTCCNFAFPGPRSSALHPWNFLNLMFVHGLLYTSLFKSSQQFIVSTVAGFRGFLPCSDSQNWEPKAVGHRVTPTVEMELLLPRAAEDPVDTKKKLQSILWVRRCQIDGNAEC